MGGKNFDSQHLQLHRQAKDGDAFSPPQILHGLGNNLFGGVIAVKIGDGIVAALTRTYSDYTADRCFWTVLFSDFWYNETVFAKWW